MKLWLKSPKEAQSPRCCTCCKTLTLSQLHGHFVAATNELGAFQFQITDGSGQPIQGIRLLSPITLIYHYRSHELINLGLNPGRVYLIWRDLLTSASAAKQSIAGDIIPMQNNAAASTLTAQTTTLSVTPFVLSGTEPIQSPPKPNFAEVQGNGGQLSYSYPLVVPPAPTGTAPDLAVTYSSATTNDRRAPTSPANNVGDGWAITLGSISATQYPDGTIWYSISGVDNVSDRLIPDTSGNNFATEHISYLKISKVTSGTTGQPCFQVSDTESNYYEFGCTTDSLQYYIDSGGNRVNYEFDLDKMIPANQGPGTNGRNLIATYVQDQESSGGHTWIRDSALKQINYGNGTNRIGTIDFYYNGPSNYTDPGNNIQYVTQYSTSYETNCHLPVQSPQPQRCDDPIDRSGGLVDPDVMSTLSLQTIKVYTGDDNSNSKNFL